MRTCIAVLFTCGLLLTAAGAQNTDWSLPSSESDPFDSTENAADERHEGVERTRSNVLDTPTGPDSLFITQRWG